MATVLAIRGPKPEKKHHCPACPRSYATPAALAQHQRDSNHQETTAQTEQAVVTSTGFISSVPVGSTNLPSTAAPDARKLPCPLCSRKFASQSALRQHTRDQSNHAAKAVPASAPVPAPPPRTASTVASTAAVGGVSGTASGKAPRSRIETPKYPPQMSSQGCSTVPLPSWYLPNGFPPGIQDPARFRAPTSTPAVASPPKKAKAGQSTQRVVATQPPELSHIPPRLYQSLMAATPLDTSMVGRREPAPPDNRWTSIPPSERDRALRALQNAAHSRETLLENDYAFPKPEQSRQELSDELLGLVQCDTCGLSRKAVAASVTLTPCRYHPGYTAVTRCNHPTPYTCCKRETWANGCQTASAHTFSALPPPILDRTQHLSPTPPPNPSLPPSHRKRRAVSLDCEMCAVTGSFREVIHVSAIDYLTNEVLLDLPVAPTAAVLDWSTAVTGMTGPLMDAAVHEGRALRGGWREARERLFDYVDADTVLVGQSLCFDLAVLGVAHGRVVDSAVLTQRERAGGGGGGGRGAGKGRGRGGGGGRAAGSSGRARGRGRGRGGASAARNRYVRTGLKALCAELLHVDVQSGAHDALEDAFATREVVLWCLGHADQLRRWVEKGPGPRENDGKGNSSKNVNGKGKGAAKKRGGVGGGPVSRTRMLRSDSYSDPDSDGDGGSYRYIYNGSDDDDFPFTRLDDIVAAHGAEYGKWYAENEAPLGYDSDWGYFY